MLHKVQNFPICCIVMISIVNISTLYEIWCDECALWGVISINFNQQHEFENYMLKTYRSISQGAAQCSVSHMICTWLCCAFFAVLCKFHEFLVYLCDLITILFRVALPALEQSYDCTSTSEITLYDMGKICVIIEMHRNSINLSSLPVFLAFLCPKELVYFCF